MYNTFIEWIGIDRSHGGGVMNLRVLEYFIVVAKEGTISGAAKLLHLSQPTLSKQLKEFESDLGVTLFNRNNKGIRLTEQGLFLLERGQEITDLVKKTKNSIGFEQSLSGTISIGSAETRNFEIISDTVKDLQARHPNVSVDIQSGNADEVLLNLDKGLVDYALVIDPVDKTKYNFMQIPKREVWGVLVAKSHQLFEKSDITNEMLAEYPLYISKQTLVNNQMREWLGGAVETFNVIGTYNLLNNAAYFIDDKTIVLCIDGVIENSDNRKFIPLRPSLSSALNILWKKDRVFSNVGVEFHRVLKEGLGK